MQQSSVEFSFPLRATHDTILQYILSYHRTEIDRNHFGEIKSKAAHKE